MPLFSEGRRYNSFVGYFRERYGTRLQKIVVDAGFTCPNRDGSAGMGGCTYCDNDAFHPSYSTPDKPIIQQIEEGIAFHKNRYRRAAGYLVYFQSYSNTYAPLEILKKRYYEALSHPEVRGVVLGTRPDCIDSEKLDWLAELAREKVVIVEYGVESVYDTTLKRINRGHDYATTLQAIEETAKRGIDQGAHFIFGLPGESKEQMIAMAAEINKMAVNSVKFHQLQIVKGTYMEQEFAESPQDFVQFSLGGYSDFFIDFLGLLRPDIHIERFAGEVPPKFVNNMPWGTIRYTEIHRLMEKRLSERDTWQSRRYNP